MKKSEILFVLALLIPLPFIAIAKQWHLFWTFAIFYVCFGLMEWHSVKTSGRSISQKFWDYSENNKVMAWVILLVMAVMWVGLLIHLGIRLF